jgi:exo-beta-1,3-glucanase (GH17 family)
MANSSVPVGPFDVFISAKSEDFPLASEVRNFLVKQGLKVFLSDVSVAEVGDSLYSRTIEAAIETSSHMIVVASSVENVTSGWVEFEWTLFNNDVRSGKKKGGNLITLLGGSLTANDLPGTLRTHEALPCRPDQFGKLLSFLRTVGNDNPSVAGAAGISQHKVGWLSKAKWPILAVCVAAIVVVYFTLIRPAANPPDRVFEESRDSLFGAMPWLNWVIYDPTGYDPFNQPMPSEASIRMDLEVLAKHGFNGLITMTSKGNCREIARVARQLGFVKIVVGVWDIRDQGEVGNALSAATWADAYCLGHRGSEKRYPLQELEEAITRFRTQTHHPITTSEVLATYESNPEYVAVGDFLFPDVHAYWHDGQTPAVAWQQTVASALKADELVVKEMQKTGKPKKPVMLKMVSFPSGGASGLTETSQLEFYRLAIRESPMKGDLPGGMSLAFFSAFDELWKTENRGFATPEKSTGLFHDNREPKQAVTKLDWSRKFR